MIALAPIEARGARGYFEVAPELSFQELSAKDTSTGGTATLSSSVIPGVRAGWLKPLGKRFTLGVAARARWANLGELPGKTMSGTSQLMLGAALDLRARLNRYGTVLVASAGLEDKLFFHAPSATAISVETLKPWVLEGGLKQRLFKARGYVFHLQGTYRWLSSGTGTGYAAESGSGWSGTLLFDKRVRKKPLVWSGGAFYSREKQDTSVLELETTAIGMFLGLRF